MIRSYYLCATLAALLTAQAARAQQTVWGMATAKDGDSLMVGETEVRLFGVDAPEFDQTCTRNKQAWSCGAAAAEQLMFLVTGKDVECVSMGIDDHKRTLGRCTVRGTDVNEAMVASGYAVAYRRYSSDYVAAEEAAKAAKLGLWAGSFEAPEQYRRTGGVKAGKANSTSRPSQRSSWAARAPSNCNIKGNRNRRGEWIYHLPGMPYYDQTRPEEMFCSEAEAQAAGYQRAMVR
jgi:endonuclease YncB( thermonuclease family)